MINIIYVLIVLIYPSMLEADSTQSTLATSTTLRQETFKKVWHVATQSNQAFGAKNYRKISTETRPPNTQVKDSYPKAEWIMSYVIPLLLFSLLLFLIFQLLGIAVEAEVVIAFVIVPFLIFFICLDFFFFFYSHVKIHENPSMLKTKKEVVKETRVVAVTPVTLKPRVSQTYQERLQESMSSIILKHTCNHALECGYDVLLNWLDMNGVNNPDTGEAYQIEDLRSILAKKRGPYLTEYKQLSSLRLTDEGIIFLLNSLSSHSHSKLKPLSFISWKINNREDWNELLDILDPYFKDEEMVLMTLHEAAYNAYAIDREKDVIKLLDPHQEGEDILKEWRYEDLLNQKESALYLIYPTQEKQERIQVIKEELEEASRVKKGLKDELWGDVFYAAKLVHFDYFPDELVELHEESKIYVQGINDRFYSQVERDLKDRNLSLHLKALKTALAYFRKGLKNGGEHKLSRKSASHLLRYIFEEIPIQYKLMVRHYSWLVLGEEVLIEEMTEDQRKISLKSLFQNYPFLEKYQQEGTRFHFDASIKTPAEYRPTKKGEYLILLHPGFISSNMDQKSQLFMVSQLLHEFLRTQKRFRDLSPFEMISKRLQENGSVSLLKKDIAGERALLLEELSVLYKTLSKDEWLMLREYLRELYDLDLLKRDLVLENRKVRLDWDEVCAVYNEFKKEKIGINYLEDKIDSYLLNSVYA